MSLQRHILAEHPRSFFYVRANGAIVDELVFIDEELTSMEVVAIGSSALTLRVDWANGLSRDHVVTPGQPLDLVGAMGRVTSPGVVALRGAIGGSERAFRLNIIEPPVLDLRFVDDMARLAQQPLESGRVAAWETLRDEGERQRDDAMRRYCRGHASYLLGCSLEGSGNWQKAKEPFEEAFELLRPFATDLARDVRGVLQFRRLDLQGLLRRGKSSVWWQAANFFQSPAQIEQGASSASLAGVWMDDYQSGLVEALGRYCASDLDAADQALSRLPRELESEPGNALKLTILEARIAVARADRARARSCYSRLRHDSLYASEAAKWL